MSCLEQLIASDVTEINTIDEAAGSLCDMHPEELTLFVAFLNEWDGVVLVSPMFKDILSALEWYKALDYVDGELYPTLYVSEYKDFSWDAVKTLCKLKGKE